MKHKNFIFISPSSMRFFCSDVEDPIEGFRPMKSYKLALGGIDKLAFDYDRLALLDGGWVEIPSPQYININLYYMKESGKFYSDGVLSVQRGPAEENPAKDWMEILDRIRSMLDSGNLPGLVKGSKLTVFVTGEGHPGGYPALFHI